MNKLRDIEYYINENGCWICTSHYTDKHGYPHIKRDGRDYGLARYLYMQKNGILSSNIVIRHTCDNPACINVEHLITGTHEDNIKDKVERGRQLKGSKNGNSKLTEEKVREIILQKELSSSALARKYGVDVKVISNIRHNISWKHVERS